MTDVKTILLIFAAVAVALVASGCDINTCLLAAKKECDLCSQPGDWEKTYCTCVEDGKLDRDSAYVNFETDEDAELWCDRTIEDLSRSGRDYGAYCRQELNMYNQWGEDWCEGIQWGGYYYDYWDYTE